MMVAVVVGIKRGVVVVVGMGFRGGRGWGGRRGLGG